MVFKTANPSFKRDLTQTLGSTNSRVRTQPFILQLQRRTAQAAIGASSLRNQGAPGVISVARDELAELNLLAFSRGTRVSFHQLLNRSTDKLLKRFPPKAQSWGAARKALNLFLRDAVYNQDLSHFYGLSEIRGWLEVPLDKDVGTKLCAEPEGKNLPKWIQIKTLQLPVSAQFQSVASAVATRKRMHRVDLDIYYWRPKDAEA